MFETERYWVDAETQRWVAHDLTWDLVTSGNTEDEAKRNLKSVREHHLKHPPLQ